SPFLIGGCRRGFEWPAAALASSPPAFSEAGQKPLRYDYFGRVIAAEGMTSEKLLESGIVVGRRQGSGDPVPFNLVVKLDVTLKDENRKRISDPGKDLYFSYCLLVENRSPGSS